MSESKFLSIHSSYTYHEPAYIIGNKSALLALRDAIDKSLIDGRSEFEAFPSDGEGYALRMICVPSEPDFIRPQYTEDYIEDKSSDLDCGIKSPCDIWKFFPKKEWLVENPNTWNKFESALNDIYEDEVVHPLELHGAIYDELIYLGTHFLVPKNEALVWIQDAISGFKYILANSESIGHASFGVQVYRHLIIHNAIREQNNV